MYKTRTSRAQKLEKAYLTLTELLVRRCGMSLSILASGKSPAPSPNYKATDLLNCDQAANVLGLSVKTLANWRVSGTQGLQFRRIGGAIRYQYADLLSFADSHKRLNTSQNKETAK